MHASSLPRLVLCLLILGAMPLHAAVQVGDPIGSFDIARLEVAGDTLLGASAVQAAVAGFAGTGRDFGYVERAMAALEAIYHKRGFGLVKVILPEQELNGGVVHLTVIETRIGKVRVAGNTAHSEANIRRSLPAVAEGIIPNTDAISADLRIANENPSKKVNLELQSSSQPGVIDALEQVTDQRTWSVGGVVDNSGYESSCRNHVTAQYQNFDLGDLD